jgi:hypothetical protein
MIRMILTRPSYDAPGSYPVSRLSVAILRPAAADLEEVLALHRTFFAEDALS